MASSNEENTKNTAGDIERSSDFSDSVTQGIPSSKHDLRRSILQGSDTESGILVSTGRSIKTKLFCDLCKQEKETVPAEGFCVDCNEYLCTSCFNFHKKQKNLNHLLKDKSCMPLDREARNTNDVCIDRCTIHMDKIIEYFCQSCDQLGCSACFVTGHRECKIVDFIPEIISGKVFDEVCKQVERKVQQTFDELILHKNRVASNIERSKELRKKAKEKIVKQRHEVDSIFDRMEKEMHSSVDEIYHDDQSSLTEVSDLVNSLTTEVSHMHSDLGSKSRNRCQHFVASKLAEKRMKAIENDVGKLKSSNKVQKFQYIPSNQLLDELSNIEIGKFNRINSYMTKRIASFRNFNISHKEDVNKNTVHEVTGICLMGNCRIVVIDRTYSTCKLVDLRTEQIISYAKLDGDPFDVTNLSDNEVAVTFPFTGEIKFLMFSDDGSVNEQRIINVGIGCSGVHYFNERLVVVFKKTARSTPRTDIMDVQGKIVNTIEKDEHGRQIFDSPLYVTVCHDSSTIYVTDRRNGIVTGMTMDGKVKNKYVFENLKGITVDEYGSIFVCSYREDTDSSITQLSENCELVKVLLQHDNAFYCAIAYCKEYHSFYLTHLHNPIISVLTTENVEMA